MKPNEKREWLNTIINFSILIVMIIGIYQIYDININLKKFSAEEIYTKNITSINYKSIGNYTQELGDGMVIHWDQVNDSTLRWWIEKN